MHYQIMVTRFNNLTWFENCRWRESNNYIGCIYNSPIYIKDNIELKKEIYVIEMNNESNQIIGIGKIINYVHADNKYKIYEDRNYNRYTYKGNKRIDRENIIDKENLEKLELRLFKGKNHLKRGQGIQTISLDIYNKFCKFIINNFENL